MDPNSSQINHLWFFIKAEAKMIQTSPIFITITN